MSRQTVILVIVVILFGGTGFLWYRYLQTLPSVPGGAGETTEVERAINLAELRRLRNLKLDTALLRDPFFRSLALPATALVPEIRPGNPNPFQPR